MKQKKYLLIFVFYLFLLIILITKYAFAEEFKVIGISKNEIYCQILNQNGDCQLIDNQLSVKIRSKVKYLDVDIEFIYNNKEIVKAYSYGCTKKENIYVCYFEIEPIINIKEPRYYDIIFYFYKELSNKSFAKEKYQEKFKIIPIYSTNTLSVERQKSKLIENFLTVKNFDKEVVYDSGICYYLGMKAFSDKLDEYENFLKELITSFSFKTYSDKAINLLISSSTLSSLYAGYEEVFFSKLLENLLQQGLFTGNLINQIIYHLREGYISGDIYENLKNDVYGSCEIIARKFELLLNPNFLVIQKLKLINCLQQIDFKNCWKQLEVIERYTNPRRVPERTELRIYFEGSLIRDGSNVCNGAEINIINKNLYKFGINYIKITGKGEKNNCENIIYLNNNENKVYSVQNFLCGDTEKPVDGEKYYIEIDPLFEEKIIYIINYYDDQEKCKIKQEIVHI